MATHLDEILRSRCELSDFIAAATASPAGARIKYLGTIEELEHDLKSGSVEIMIEDRTYRLAVPVGTNRYGQMIVFRVGSWTGVHEDKKVRVTLWFPKTMRLGFGSATSWSETRFTSFLDSLPEPVFA